MTEPGHQPAAEHPVELGDAGGHRLAWRRPPPRRWRMGTDRAGEGRQPAAGRADAGTTGSSASVPDASHAGHHPVHFGASAPHSEQR